MSVDIAPVHNFIVETFLFGDTRDFNAATSFRQQGILDSTGILELVAHLESTYQLTVEPHELVPENLDTLNSIAAFVAHKRSAAATL